MGGDIHGMSHPADICLIKIPQALLQATHP